MKWNTVIIAAFLWGVAFTDCSEAQRLESVKIFPIPQKTQILNGSFIIDDRAFIAVLPNASEHDIFLAKFLCAELEDRYGAAIKIKTVSQITPGQKAILMGTTGNRLVNAACRAGRIDVNSLNQHAESYILRTDVNAIIIAAKDDAGAFYGLQSLRQLIKKNNENVSVCGILVEDEPYKQLRGIRLYMPGENNIPFFKRFLKDFAALYKFNTLILEVGTCMRLDRHPEINAGWVEFAKELQYSRRDRPVGPNKEPQDSANYDAGDGGIVEKEDVSDVVQYARRLHIDVIPEIPSLTHSYYLLTRHRELAEIQNAEWPDAYCPSNPASYDLLFDVFDECIEVIKPRMVHIGHDEWRIPLNVCPRCKGIEYNSLYAQDVSRIYNYLHSKDIAVALWGDHLVEAVSGRDAATHKVSKEYSYALPGALTSEEVSELIPKDILVFNWFWDESKSAPNEERGQSGEENDMFLEEMGFKQVYGNLLPNIRNWGRRSVRDSVMGGAVSSWAATTEYNFGKDLIYDFLGCANLLWSRHWLDANELQMTVRDMMPQIRSDLRGIKEPSDDNNVVSAVDINAYRNIESDESICGKMLTKLWSGVVRYGTKQFQLPDANNEKCAIVIGSEGDKKTSLPAEIRGIKIGKDVSSIIFLHACALAARNEYTYRYVYNYEDTADLLGWYEVVYEDGFVVTVPIRYGVNILEWNADRCLYGADAVNCARDDSKDKVNFYAFEWLNPRLGKQISEINIKGSVKFKGLWGKMSKTNAVAVIAINITEPRKYLAKEQ